MARTGNLDLEPATADRILSLLGYELGLHVERQNQMSKLPKLASLTKAYDQLVHNIEADAEKAHNRIASTDARRPVVMGKIHEGIGAVNTSLDDINSVFDSLIGDNSPPLENSDSSPTSPAGQSTENPT